MSILQGKMMFNCKKYILPNYLLGKEKIMMTAKLIASLIKSQKKCLYTYPGGTIAPVFHECTAINVPLICAKTEQGAGYMAIADATVSGSPAFVAVTSGPGATNLITCIADAFYDSIPLIALTGQVGTPDLSRNETLRQRGFQEAPIVDMVSKITKAAFQPRTPQELADALVSAMSLTLEGRPGPVLIDLPMDMQMNPLPDGLVDDMLRKLAEKCVTEPPLTVGSDILTEICASLALSSRPIVLAGGGALSSHRQLRAFARRFCVPVVTSMRGLGVFPTDDPLFAGWIGHTGLPWANWTLSQSDWVLVLGSRLDVRQTGNLTDHFSDKTVFHVDVDTNELAYGRIPGVKTVHCSVATMLDGLAQEQGHAVADFSDWLANIAGQHRLLSLEDRGKSIGVPPDKLLAYVDLLTREKQTAVVTGVGSHQQWAARYFTYDVPKKKLFTSAGHGTMGYALPVALGVKQMQPTRLVICVDGDGSFQMNIQELAMIGELRIPLKILIMDNSRLGIVSQFQQITFADDPTTGTFRNPDFFRIAEAYGLKVWDLPEMDEKIIEAWLKESGPALLIAHIQHDAPVSPMLLGGQSLEAMWYARGDHS